MRNIITIDIGASKIRFMAVKDNKEVTEYLDTPTVDLVGRELKNSNLVKILTDNISRLRHNIQTEGDTVSAISIGSPGSLDPVRGVILNPPNLKGIRNLAIVDELKDIFKLPVFLLNDADAALLGEHWLRSNRESENIIYLTLSTGVGSGILKRGELLNEKVELGHQPITIEGKRKRCSCGELNHVEAYLGTKGLAEIYTEIFEIKKSLTSGEQYSTSSKMRKGVADLDPKWLLVQARYAKYLAIFLRNIFLNFRPELVILGGGIIFENASLFSKTRYELERITSKGEVTKIELALSGKNVNLGVAKYALEQLEN